MPKSVNKLLNNTKFKLFCIDFFKVNLPHFSFPSKITYLISLLYISIVFIFGYLCFT